MEFFIDAETRTSKEAAVREETFRLIKFPFKNDGSSLQQLFLSSKMSRASTREQALLHGSKRRHSTRGDLSQRERECFCNVDERWLEIRVARASRQTLEINAKHLYVRNESELFIRNEKRGCFCWETLRLERRKKGNVGCRCLRPRARGYFSSRRTVAVKFS